MVLWQGLTEGGTAVPVQVTEDGKVIAQGQQGEPGPPGPPGPEGPEGPQGEYGPGDNVEFGTGSFSGPISPGAGDAGMAFADKPGDIGECLISTNTTSIDSSRTANIGAQVQPWRNGYFSGRCQVGSSYTGENISRTQGAAIYDGYFSCTNSQGQYSIFEGYLLNTTDPTILFKANGQGKFASSVTVGPQNFSADVASGAFISQNGAVYVQNSTVATQGDATCFGAYYGRSEVISFKSDGSSEFCSNKCGFTPEGEIYFTSRGDRFRIIVQQNICYAEPYTREIELRERLERRKKPDPRDSVGED